MKYSEYATWLQQEYSQINLGPRSAELGPYLGPTVDPDSPPWQMKWAVIFDDNHYFCVTENWWKRRRQFGSQGYRKHFCFHYGPANPVPDQDGIPEPSRSYPAIFRIDCDTHGPHIHFQGEDHIGQNRVDGFAISDAQPFLFVQAVMRHRLSGDGFDEIMQFRVKA
jgi:hypothetical protein